MKKFFPKGGRQLFDGGLNDKYAANIIEDNESPDCLNVVYNAGAVETRQGVRLVNTTSVGSFACDGIYSYRNNTNQESMCAFFGGLMYTLSGTTFYTVPSAQSIFTAGSRIASEQAENYIFFCNGNGPSYKFNGAFTRHGIPAPTQTMTVVSNGAGNLTGGAGYLYGYSYVNTNLVESNLFPIPTTFVISSTSGQNTLGNIATAPVSYGVNSVYLYRTAANSLTPFMRIGTIAAGVASFNDNVPDSLLALAGTKTANGLPPNYTTIVYAKNFLFCNDPASPNMVRYSNAGNPYTFNPNNFFLVGDNTSDIVKGLAYYDNSVVIFCEKSIWFLYLQDATPADWLGPIRTNSPMGSKSPYGFVLYNNKILFPAMWNQQFVGFGALAGNATAPSSTFLTVMTAGSQLQSDRLEPDMYQVQAASVGNISAIVFKKKAWIAVTYGTGATTNNRVYQMDFSMSNLKKDQELSWCPFTFAGLGPNPAQFCVYGGNLYYGTADPTGQVYQCESGNYDDAGAAINSYSWTKEFVGDESDEEGSDTNLVKDFRYVNMLADNSGTYNMNFTYKIDADSGMGNVLPVVLNPGGTNWAAFLWGTGTWGGAKLSTEFRLFLQNARGRRIQFKFDNQNKADQKFKVYGLNFLYNIKGIR